MELGILGPLEIRVGGRTLEIGSPKLRALLILLILEVGRTVPIDRLVDDLWAGDPPSQALVSLRSYVSNMRKLFAGAGVDPGIIATRGRGYALTVDPGAVDAVVFERLVTDARRNLEAGTPALALTMLEEAEALWRGEALADVLYQDFAQPSIARLDELRLSAAEDRAEALLTIGRHLDALPTLESVVARHALRERPHAQLMLALYRAGRAPEALDVFNGFRRRMIDELGLEPSPSLTTLFDRILRQAPELDHLLPTAKARPEAVSPAASRTPRRPPLVGRDDELTSLASSVQRLLDGRGDIILVGGEAGIGKSTLLEAFVELARDEGVRAHWARCDETEGAPPFWPWVQLVRSIAAELSDDELRDAASGPARPITHIIDEVAVRVGDRVAPEGADPESARFALYEAIATFLLRAVERNPSILVIDDLHWADTTSLRLLAFVSSRLRSVPALLAVSYRDLPADRSAELDAALASATRSDAKSLSLRGLTREQVSVLLKDVSGGPPDGSLVARVHDRTGGNPFFVTQLAQLIDATSAPERGFEVPEAVRHVILRRLQLLHPDTRRTLEIAAVAGREFDLRILAIASGLDLGEVFDHVDEAISHGLAIDPHEHALSYQFAHALINETIYLELPPGRAARIHAAVGDALEQRGHVRPADLAEHFWRAADLIEDDRPITYMRAAAEEALAVLAYEQGEVLLRRVLHLLAHRPGEHRSTELEVRLRLIALLTSVQGWTTDKIHDLVAPTRDIALETGITTKLVPLWWSLWTHYTTRGDLVGSQELAHTLMSAAAKNEPGACHVAGHVASAYSILHAQGDHAAALHHCVAARLAEAEADPVLLATTPENLSVALRVTEALAFAHAGDEERALQVADEAVEVATSVGGPFVEAYALLFAGWVAAMTRQPERALGYTEPGLRICEELGFPYVAVLTTPVDAWARARTGGDPTTEADRIAASVESLRVAGHRHAEAQWLLLLAEVHLLTDQRAEAARCLDEARETIALTSERFYDVQLAELQAALAGTSVPS